MKPQECPERHEELSEPAAAQLARFTAAERERLVRLRRLVQRGERSEQYPRDRRQDFVRWLVEQGKLSDN